MSGLLGLITNAIRQRRAGAAGADEKSAVLAKGPAPMAPDRDSSIPPPPPGMQRSPNQRMADIQEAAIMRTESPWAQGAQQSDPSRQALEQMADDRFPVDARSVAAGITEDARRAPYGAATREAFRVRR